MLSESGLRRLISTALTATRVRWDSGLSGTAADPEKPRRADAA